jgi:hypothetical protein
VITKQSQRELAEGLATFPFLKPQKHQKIRQICVFFSNRLQQQGSISATLDGKLHAKKQQGTHNSIAIEK